MFCILFKNKHSPARQFSVCVWSACRDMVAEFERVSMAMSEPDADLDALTHKMSRLQV